MNWTLNVLFTVLLNYDDLFPERRQKQILVEIRRFVFICDNGLRIPSDLLLSSASNVRTVTTLCCFVKSLQNPYPSLQNPYPSILLVINMFDDILTKDLNWRLDR